MCFCRLKKIDTFVEKFLEDFNVQVQKLSADEFEKFVSCVFSCDAVLMSLSVKHFESFLQHLTRLIDIVTLEQRMKIYQENVQPHDMSFSFCLSLSLKHSLAT